jgi:hypothetical protein
VDALVASRSFLAALVLIGFVAAFVLSVVTRRRYPRTAPMLQLALAGMTLDRLLPVLVNAYQMAGGASVADVRLVVDIVAMLCLLAGLVLLVLTLFARRAAETPPSRHQPPPPAYQRRQPGWPQQQPPQPQQSHPYGPGQYR